MVGRQLGKLQAAAFYFGINEELAAQRAIAESIEKRPVLFDRIRQDNGMRIDNGLIITNQQNVALQESVWAMQRETGRFIRQGHGRSLTQGPDSKLLAGGTQ